jgi:hypothetical protein
MEKAASRAVKASILGGKKLANLGFELFWSVDFHLVVCVPAQIAKFAPRVRVYVPTEKVLVAECISYIPNTMCKVTVIST